MPPKKTPSVLGYPAENEDIYTVMNGKDGEDYIVELVDGIKTWLPYERLPNDEEVIEYVYEEAKETPPKEEPKKPVKKKEPAKKPDVPKPAIKEKKPTVYNIKLGEFMKKIAAENPEVEKGERMKRAQQMYREWKAEQV